MSRRTPSVDLTTMIGSVRLPNPVCTASGTSGHGDELADVVAEVLMQTGERTPTWFSSITTACCLPGRSAEAMAWGSDLTRLLTRLTDRPITFVRTVFGRASELGWYIDLADLDDAERVDRLATTDAAWIESTGDGGEYFLPDSFDHQLWRWLR